MSVENKIQSIPELTWIVKILRQANFKVIRHCVPGLHSFLRDLHMSQSVESLVERYLFQALSLCLKRLMSSELIQGKCLPLTVTVLNGACLSITLHRELTEIYAN